MKKIPHRNSTKSNLAGRMEAKNYYKYRMQLDVCLQMCMDSAMIAANEVLGLGAGRAKKFGRAYVDTVNEISKMLTVDSKDDATLSYSTSKIDERLRKIVGEEHFVDWDGRYGRK